jgi:hypothetical protein
MRSSPMFAANLGGRILLHRATFRGLPQRPCGT